MSFFSFSKKTAEGSGLPAIFPFSMESEPFVEIDVMATYTKILVDTLEKTHGITENIKPLLWDNCSQDEANKGLVSLLASAMYKKSDLFLVWAKDVNVLREATSQEREEISQAYKEKRAPKPGTIYISFKKYSRTDILKIYSGMEYCVINSFHKTINVAKALQFKISELRASVSLIDSEVARTQAKSMSEALGDGKDIYCDSKDLITTSAIDITPTEKAIAFLNTKRAYYLSAPLSYITGEQTPGIGSTGEQDTRATDKFLSEYFFSIISPVLSKLFGLNTTFKSRDFRHINSGLAAMKAFDTSGDQFISLETKRDIICSMFDLDSKKEADLIEKQEPKEEPIEVIQAKVPGQVAEVPKQV